MKKTKEFEQFDQAMGTILRADPKAVKEAMEAEKNANAEKRKAKQLPSAFDHEASDRG
ncbi:MAG TPA: hypothetical protein VKX41_11980 [Alloacidobacterium sp.]|nr:hypothetical protein [Alloacidobacterium sp.]